MSRGKRISLDEQLALDMRFLLSRPEFLRFLFTMAQKANIAGAAYGSNLDTSSFDGRRSLGIDMLQLADAALPVRDPALAPFNVLGLAIEAASRFTTQEGSDDAEEDDQSEYIPTR